MSWKESKVRLLPPPQSLNPQDRKPDIQDLFLLASQATALRATALPVAVAQDQLPDSNTGGRQHLALPLHPVKVEPGNAVIHLPPPSKLLCTSRPPRLPSDCAIMPPPPPPPPRTLISPSTSVSSTSEDLEMMMQHHHQQNIEFDGNDQVLCRVCGDKASGFHYGVHSCEGCKGFFRRSIQQKIQYRPCTKNQQCNILRINRNRCQYCRLKKCIAAGMSRDAVRFGRVPKREKAKILAAMQSSRMKTQESKVMGELNDDAKIIDCIVRAHYDTCDYTRKKMEPFLQRAKANPKYISCCGTTCPMKGRPEESFMEQFSERFMDHVRQVCTFAKLIPGFKCLHHDDQVTLLKSCVFEVLLVRLAGLFDNQSLVCLNGDIIRKDTINAMPPGNAKFLMDSVFELAQRMNQFRLSDAEIGLFCAVVIITPDRPGLRNPELLTRIQNKLKMVLNSILLPQHPENESIFPELMTMVHDLRTLNTLHTEKFLQQCKINESINPGVANNSSVVNFEASQQRWDSVHLDRESTGNGSPQSSSGGDTHSSTSLEDTSSRRSPMGSVSSTDSSSSTCEVSKLLSTVQDLRMNNNGSNTNNSSVLMTALTSNGGVTISRKASVSTPVTTTCPMVGTSTVSSLKYKTARKVESPNDSGIELSLNHVASAAASMATYSTNNSVCSSPRSSSESLEKRSTSSASPPSEERHPLLKRALQQPPQLYNNGVATFQDEVYKPHKKFRRHTNSFSKSGDDCPSSSTQRSSSPEVPMSLLASQLAEPIQSYQLHHAVVGRSTASRATPPAPGVPASISSLLASTLSQRIPMASEESKRNEILAQLILDGGHLQRRYQPQQPQKQQQQPHQGLLMCAPVTTSSTSTSSSSSSFASWEPRASTSIKSSCSGPPHTSRHIPVATLPTKPNRQAAAATASKASSTVTSGEIATSAAASVLQPLNLSKRTTTSTSSATSSASLSSSSTTTSSSTEASSDIPTEA